MNQQRPEVPQPTCEKCWLKKHAHWEPESVDDEGNILFRLKSVDVPLKYNTGAVEACRLCGEITISGIYELTEEEPKFTKKQVKRGFGFVEEYGTED